MAERQDSILLSTCGIRVLGDVLSLLKMGSLAFHITPFLSWKFEVYLGERASFCFSVVCSGLSCLCWWHSLGHMLARLHLEQLPDEFDLPGAIVEGGQAEAAWTLEARGHLDKRPQELSRLPAARTCSYLRVLLSVSLCQLCSWRNFPL